MAESTHGYIDDGEFVMICDNGHAETRMDRHDGADGIVAYVCPVCGSREMARASGGQVDQEPPA